MDHYNEEEALKEWSKTNNIRNTLLIGFPYAQKIMGLVGKQLKCDRSLMEDAVQEAWMDIIHKDHSVTNLFGYLVSFVRNKALNLRRKEKNQDKMKRLIASLLLIGGSLLAIPVRAREEKPEWFCVETLEVGRKDKHLNSIALNHLGNTHKFKVTDCYYDFASPGVFTIELILVGRSYGVNPIMSGSITLKFRRRGEERPFLTHDLKIDPVYYKAVRENLRTWLPAVIDQVLLSYFKMDGSRWKKKEKGDK